MGAGETFRLTTLQVGVGWFPEQPGGLDRYFFDLVRYLPGVGVGVRGLVSGSSRAALDSSGVVTSFGLPEESIVRRWLGVRREARAQLALNPTILPATHFALYAFPLLGTLRDRPWVMHFHGPWSQEAMAEGAGARATRLRAMIERRVYTRATRCITLSRAFAKVLEESFGVAGEHIRIIPGGVDIDRFCITGTKESTRHLLGWPTDRPIVLAVRRLARRMGLELLVSAARAVREKVPEVLFLVAGRGAMAGELNARIVDSGVQDTVRLLGYVPDEQLPLMYRSADLGIVPSVALEGFGLIAAESLAAGTPVLVTPVGGLPDVVTGLDSDLVLPGASVGDIAAGIIAALTGALRLPGEAACSQFARTHYAWPVIADRIRQAYQEAIQS